MKILFHAGALLAVALLAPSSLKAQNVIFNDNFSSSTINGDDGAVPPTATSTSYDFDSQKTGAESISSGNLNMSLTAATTGGFVEAEALFTTTPVALTAAGNYVDLTYTFTDSGNLLAGGSASQIYTGLFSSGGAAPAPGTVGTGNSGNAVSLTGAASPTGNAAGWQGYVSRIAGAGGASESYNRPVEVSATGTSSAQDLLGNKDFSGGYGKATPSTAGTAIGANMTSTVSLTTSSQYTIDYRLTLTATGQISISDNLYAGVGTGGTDLSSQTTTTGATTLLNTSFDGLAIGILNSGTSFDPAMDINQISVSDNLQAVPEPDTFALFAGSIALAQMAWRRRQPRA